MPDLAFSPFEPDKNGPLLVTVVAVAENGVIGRDGGLAWKISDDLKWFKRMTVGKPVVMGRKTFESIGRPLPDRINIVVTRDTSFTAEGCRIAYDLEAAMAEAEAAAKATSATEICVIGGAQIYAQIFSRTDRIYFTQVRAEVAGDVFLPPLDPGAFRKVKVGEAMKSAKNEHPCEFFILDRRSVS